MRLVTAASLSSLRSGSSSGSVEHLHLSLGQNPKRQFFSQYWSSTFVTFDLVRPGSCRDGAQVSFVNVRPINFGQSVSAFATGTAVGATSGAAATGVGPTGASAASAFAASGSGPGSVKHLQLRALLGAKPRTAVLVAPCIVHLVVSTLVACEADVLGASGIPVELATLLLARRRDPANRAKEGDE